MSFQIWVFIRLVFRYVHIASNTILTLQFVKTTHFIGDPLNFPGTHSNDHLWVPGLTTLKTYLHRWILYIAVEGFFFGFFHNFLLI